MTESLELRIAEAVALHPTSAAVELLIGEVETTTAEIEESIALARDRALDPTIIGEDAHAAGSEVDKLTFGRDRLHEAKRRLQARLLELREAEKQARRQEEYDVARMERDALAKDLAALYPDVAPRLAQLMANIKASDDKLNFINSRLPSGAEPLLSAELVARGLGGFQDGLNSVPSIKGELRLPKFSYSAHEPYEWPRRQ